MSYAAIETLKTIGRGIYFALLGIVALILTVIITSPEIAQATITVPVLEFKVSVGTMIVAAAASLAKVVDRYRHKSDSGSNGIAPEFLQK